MKYRLEMLDRSLTPIGHLFSSDAYRRCRRLAEDFLCAVSVVTLQPGDNVEFENPRQLIIPRTISFTGCLTIFVGGTYGP